MSFNQTVATVWRCAKGTWMVPVHPEDFQLLGFSFDGQYFMDKVLLMGCSISCAAFEQLNSFFGIGTSAVYWLC